MAHDIAGTLELDDLLARVQKRTTEVLPCDGVATVQYDTPTDSFRMLSQVGMPAALIAATADLPLPRSARSGVGVRAETVVINDLAERGEAMAKLFRQHGLTALAAVPLLVHGRLVGTLVAFMTGEKRFHAPQVQLLESIGQQLGVAIEAADLYAAQREEGTVAAALARVGRELISELDRPVLLDRLCRLTVEEIGCDISRTYLLDRERAEYAVVAGFGNTAEEWEALRVVRLPKQQVEQYGLHNADVIEIDLRRTTLGYDPFKAPHESPRLLAMALRRGGELVGVHEALFRSRAEPCAAAQRRIAQGLAQLASLGLENARLVEELDRASRVKADFVASMSHELRTPLNVIIGYSDLLVDQVFGELAPEQRETVRRIGEQGRELLDLVNTTLEMSRIDSGRVPLALREVDLVDLLAEIDLEAQLVRRNAALDLRWHVTPPVPRLWTDPVKLKVIIKNLLLNALKFTDEGGVLVHAESRDGGVEIAVSDTGIGIAPEMIPRMFEAFRQGDHGAARRGGVGLGLHIVRRLLDVLGGTIDVESEPQRGSTFRIWLPCNAAVERRDDVAVHAAARSVDT
jgi:signal transduction histidine kinase